MQTNNLRMDGVFHFLSTAVPTANPAQAQANPRLSAAASAAAGRTDVHQPCDNDTTSDGPLIVNLLCTSKQVYKEARDVLYGENVFDVEIATAVTSLAALHQRSRRLIRHIELEIPTYTDILERFSEVVRLSLRYCSGLQKFVVHVPFTLPGSAAIPAANGNTGTAGSGNADTASFNTSNTAVYANGFDILRWLPQTCDVTLKGNRNAEIEAVVSKHLKLAKSQDKVRSLKPGFVKTIADRFLAVCVCPSSAHQQRGRAHSTDPRLMLRAVGGLSPLPTTTLAITIAKLEQTLFRYTHDSTTIG